MYEKNPFSVQTPEDITAEEAYHLFVDVFTDFYQVPITGHTFLNGARGSGKSMMFRYMLPDCQKLKTGKEIQELDYFSIYVPIKKTTLNLINLERLENHAQFLLNEHLLVSYVSLTLFEYINKIFATIAGTKTLDAELQAFYTNAFLPSLQLAGYRPDEKDALPEGAAFIDIVGKCSFISNKIYRSAIKYFNNLFLREVAPYEGPLCGYLDFLYPVIKDLKSISLFPKEKPFFLLIDDADNLNVSQTKVLNTWVSFRTSAEISLKISTQLNYKSYRTVSGQTIDSPHDFSEVNIATVYTSSKTKYYERIKKIVEKRISIYLGENIVAEDFFPEDEKQEKAILLISENIRNEYEKNGKGATAADDVKRYARPEYIRTLKEKRSGSTYSYAGFKQLVSISSGIIRYFLEPASLMFSETKSLEPSNDFLDIPHRVQHEVIKEYSDKYIFSDYENVFKGEDEEVHDNLKNSDKLLNLLEALGGMFHTILVSDASERRVFSIALSSKPDRELDEILKMGVQLGYLHESSIGNKQGTGRTKLYILSRLLAPHFKLDPTSFAGYKFMKSELLKEALYRPQAFITRMREALNKGNEADNEIFQLNLFE